MIAKNNCCFATTNQGSLYNWGHLPRGLSLEAKNRVVDQPEKNKKLQGYQFRSISLTKDSAVAIGKSVELKFEIPEVEES